MKPAKSNPNTVYFANREEWRQWLKANYKHEKEIWLVY